MNVTKAPEVGRHFLLTNMASFFFLLYLSLKDMVTQCIICDDFGSCLTYTIGGEKSPCHQVFFYAFSQRLFTCFLTALIAPPNAPVGPRHLFCPGVFSRHFFPRPLPGSGWFGGAFIWPWSRPRANVSPPCMQHRMLPLRCNRWFGAVSSQAFATPHSPPLSLY